MESNRSEHYSGILVMTLPGRLDECVRALEMEPGMTVSVRDPDRNRLIVVLEAPSAEHLEEMHRRVPLLPSVVTASPVVHYVDDRPDDPGLPVSSQP